MQPDRLQGPRRSLRSDGNHRRTPRADPSRRVRPRAQTQGGRRGDDYAATQRPAEGDGRRDDDRGSRERDREVEARGIYAGEDSIFGDITRTAQDRGRAQWLGSAPDDADAAADSRTRSAADAGFAGV